MTRIEELTLEQCLKLHHRIATNMHPRNKEYPEVSHVGLVVFGADKDLQGVGVGYETSVLYYDGVLLSEGQTLASHLHNRLKRTAAYHKERAQDLDVAPWAREESEAVLKVFREALCGEAVTR